MEASFFGESYTGSFFCLSSKKFTLHELCSCFFGIENVTIEMLTKRARIILFLGLKRKIHFMECNFIGNTFSNVVDSKDTEGFYH